MIRYRFLFFVIIKKEKITRGYVFLFLIFLLYTPLLPLGSPTNSVVLLTTQLDCYLYALTWSSSCRQYKHPLQWNEPEENYYPGDHRWNSNRNIHEI